MLTHDVPIPRTDIARIHCETIPFFVFPKCRLAPRPFHCVPCLLRGVLRQSDICVCAEDSTENILIVAR